MDPILFNSSTYDNEYIKNITDHFENNISYIDMCKSVVKENYKFENVIFTTSCTHALEMMAMILNIGTSDEVIIPSYTYVSTANAFVKFGATIKCVDSLPNDPMINLDCIENEITSKTKAIVVVHYAGQSCDMNRLLKICKKHNIYLLEDAAQAINSFYDGKPLGSFGILSAFSFHYTKNITSGEGGMLVINNDELVSKAHIVCDKGTNRCDFLNKKVNKYEWVDKGSSYPMSELNAAYLYGQLKNIDEIISYRKKLWYIYKNNLSTIIDIQIGILCNENENNTSNYHIFYILFNNTKGLKSLQKFLKNVDIQTFTHYVSLHESKYYKTNFESVSLPNSEKITTNLLRLPLHNNLKTDDCHFVCRCIQNFYNYNVINLPFHKLTNSHIDDIINIKSQFWKYDYESQFNWVQNNVTSEDINVMIYNSEDKLIGYLLIMVRNCKILDSVIVDEKYRGCGFGNVLMNYVMSNVMEENGFLLCEMKNITFYGKYGWLQNDDINVANKTIDNELHKMVYNINVDTVTY
jgi:dTDP-4-amino-4,6-dideoxygalactose transaminase